MSINKDDLRRLIEDVLKEIGMHSESAVELLMLTAAVESKLGTYLYQMNDGPARGIFQMEPATEEWVWMRRGKKLAELFGKWRWYDLAGNIVYQIVMARYLYSLFPQVLPDAKDHEALAEYWKKHWNTIKGKGTVEKAKQAYVTYCLG